MDTCVKQRKTIYKYWFIFISATVVPHNKYMNTYIRMIDLKIYADSLGIAAMSFQRVQYKCDELGSMWLPPPAAVWGGDSSGPLMLHTSIDPSVCTCYGTYPFHSYAATTI